MTWNWGASTFYKEVNGEILSKSVLLRTQREVAPARALALKAIQQPLEPLPHKISKMTKIPHLKKMTSF